MNNLTFGRYSPYNIFTHKLDPRNKIFLLILLMVTIFFQFNLWSTTILLSAAFLLILIAFMLISRVSILDLFKSLKSMWFLILFLLIIYIFIPVGSYTHVAFYIGPSFKVYWDAFYQAGYIILRIILMIALTMVLTSTTKTMDLTYAFEWYMTPLKVFKFPSHEIAMTLSIALRFIPTLLDETSRIMKAQSSRGVDFTHGKLSRKLKAVISLIIPLFVSAIERSEELANAMEARGYNPKAPRSRYRKLSFSYRDIIGLFIVLCIFGGVLTLFIIDKNVQTVDLFQFLFKINVGF